MSEQEKIQEVTISGFNASYAISNEDMPEEMKTLAIMDYSIGEIHIYQYNSNKIGPGLIFESIEDYMLALGYKESQCHWKCSDKLILKLNPFKSS